MILDTLGLKDLLVLLVLQVQWEQWVLQVGQVQLELQVLLEPQVQLELLVSRD
jgi:hypothetical protein